MNGWVLPTVGNVLAPRAQGPAAGQLSAEAQWQGAIRAIGQMIATAIQAADTIELAAIEPDWLSPTTDKNPAPEPALQGVVLAGPLPLFTGELADRLSLWTFSSHLWQSLWLLPSAEGCEDCPESIERAIGLAPIDPLAAESFCVVRMRDFSLALSLQEDSAGQLAFRFSFDPQAIAAIWHTLRARVQLNAPHQLAQFDALARQFPLVEPNYRTVSTFTEQLLRAIPTPVAEPEPRREPVRQPQRSTHSPKTAEPAIDLELLQALAHSVRTPLATIRTFTRLLMRQDLQAKAVNYIEKIDRECTEQINRFDLIFKAVELETNNSAHLSLAPIPLAQVFQTSIPRWQQQASRHNLELTVKLPHKLPTVASDPTLLDRMLAEIIENLARTLPPGSRIDMEAETAGSQLKVQLRYDEAGAAARLGSLKSIGQLLTFQPETGSFGLNLHVTKNLFQAIGGKLTIRQRPQQGEVMTIFLPLQ